MGKEKKKPERAHDSGNHEARQGSWLQRTPGKVVLAVAFAVFAYIMLIAFNYDYLRVFENNNAFVGNSQFVRDCFEMPGGLNIYISSYLGQYFYFPWLGATVLVLLLTAIALMVAQAFKVPARWWAVSYVPSALLLLSFLSWGYAVYDLKPMGAALGLVTGTAIAMLIVWGVTSLEQWWLRLIAVAVTVGVGYPLLGFYALLAAGLCAIAEVTAKRPGNWIALPCYLVMIAVVPWLYYRYGGMVLMSANMYTNGLPWVLNLDGDGKFTVPYVAAFVVLALYAALMRLWKETTVASPIPAVAIFAGAIVVAGFGSYSDANFRATCTMDMAMYTHDWQAAIDARAKLQDTPTRLNVLYSDVALMRTGQAGDRMFEFMQGAADIQSSRKPTAMRDIAATTLSYNFGRVNNAYRWAMEYKVEYGMKPSYLMMMTKCALLNKEWDLAQKYIDALKKTKFHKGWALEQEKYVNNPELLIQDPEYRKIVPLMFYRDRLGGDGGKLESFLLPITSGLAGGTPELLELCLQCNLIQKNIDEFMSRFMSQAKNYERIPRHYQEAVLLWSMMNDKPVFKQLKIDPQVMDRFQRFNEMSRVYVNKPAEENMEIFKPLFGDTYWYYFFFINGMKTT